MATDPLERALAGHHAAVAEFVDRARSLAASSWTAPRAEGKWSPVQEAAHVALSFRAYVTELRHGPAVTPDSFPPKTPSLRSEVLPRVLAGGWFPTGAASPPGARPDEASGDPQQALAWLLEQAAEFDAAETLYRDG